MESTSLARLAAKQKRLKDWRAFAASEIQDAGVLRKTEEMLKQYSTVLAEAWESRELTAEGEARIANLERQLEQLNEEARMRVVGRVGG